MAYPTSEKYKEIIDQASRETHISGLITTQNGNVIEVDNSMIAPGSLYITNQCVDSDAFGYGSVFAAEMGISLKSEIDRYSLYGAKLALNFNIFLEKIDGIKQYETIPLGEFYADDVSRVGKNITMKAYDKMLDLDEQLSENVSGDAFAILNHLATKFNFKLAQTEEEIRSLTNASFLFSVDRDRVEKYREVLSYLCKVTCTFAAFDKKGQLRLYEFSENPTRVIQSKLRTSSKFTDFETYFKGVQADFVFSGSYKSYAKVNSNDGGLVLDLGAIPIVQGLDATHTAIISNIFLKLEKVRYVPCDISFIGDPSIELGDMIVSVDRGGAEEFNSLVTFYKWTYRSSHQIKSAGQNPRLLNTKRNESKKLENLRSNADSKEVAVHTYTNASNISVSGDAGGQVESMTQLSSISFVSKVSSTSMAMVTSTFETDSEGEVEFYQLLDDDVMLGSPVVHNCVKGRHTVTFVNYFNTQENSIHRYTIKCASKGNDKHPVVTFKPYALKVIVFGQGLSATMPWDGIVRAEEKIPAININVKNINAISFVDRVEHSQKIHGPNSISDSVGIIHVENINVNVIGVSDEVMLSDG